ncbi:hypothetical protein GALMADRAFT_254393 [Galerina marginata CBS 339.88]|uniref:Uncharacterized protein n=1 Tax=Galerina marginata (strain CBS 339.88) TaxID=685588 RepID=A0A067SU17_GALM3|nr:hypothetical protein GALMADRAFT_254393 [Galerina marginata CBS 339.88]
MRIQDLNRTKGMSRTTVVDSASLYRPQARCPEIRIELRDRVIDTHEWQKTK